jgi:hypothetical protein
MDICLRQTDGEQRDDLEFGRGRHLEVVHYQRWDDREADV